MAPCPDQQEDRPSGRSGSSALQQQHTPSEAGSAHPETGSRKAAAPTGSAFKSLAQGFLHPFNLDMNMARQHVERIKIKHKAETSSSGRGGSSRAASPAFSDDSRTFEEGGPLHEELAEELVQELVVTPELVLTMIAPLEAALLDWFKAQAAETLKDRLSKVGAGGRGGACVVIAYGRMTERPWGRHRRRGWLRGCQVGLGGYQLQGKAFPR